jgi:hypothetical protein
VVTRKIGRQRHRLPRDHEHVGVVGDQHQRHRGEERVILEADEAGRRAFARTEIAAASNSETAAATDAEKHEEERRQGIEAEMKRQSGRPSGRSRFAAAPRSPQRDRRQAPGRRRRLRGNST